MKNILLFIFTFFVLNFSFSQESNIPEWFLTELKTDVGTWTADNGKFKNEQNYIADKSKKNMLFMPISP